VRSNPQINLRLNIPHVCNLLNISARLVGTDSRVRSSIAASATPVDLPVAALGSLVNSVRVNDFPPSEWSYRSIRQPPDLRTQHTELFLDVLVAAVDVVDAVA